MCKNTPLIGSNDVWCGTLKMRFIPEHMHFLKCTERVHAGCRSKVNRWYEFSLFLPGAVFASFSFKKFFCGDNTCLGLAVSGVLGTSGIFFYLTRRQR